MESVNLSAITLGKSSDFLIQEEIKKEQCFDIVMPYHISLEGHSYV